MILFGFGKKERNHLCLQYGKCMAACTTKAIHIEGLSYEYDFSDISSHKNDYKKLSKTVILASHNLDILELYCDKVIFLENGCIRMIDKPKKVIDYYKTT